MSNVMTKDSIKKINLMEDVKTSIVAFRRESSANMETITAMANKLNMRGMDQIHNGVAANLNSLEKYLTENMAPSFENIAEGMSGKNAIVRGAAFKSKLDKLISELPVLRQGKDYTPRELSDGLTEQLDAANINSFEEALKGLMFSRRKLLTTVQDSWKTNVIEDNTRQVYVKLLAGLQDNSNALSQFIKDEAMETIQVLMGGVNKELEGLIEGVGKAGEQVVKNRENIDIYGDDK